MEAKGLLENRIFDNFAQWGYVVRDIEQAMRQWTEGMRVGPFLYIDDVGEVCCHYRGVHTDVKISVAFAYCGETQIELIQQRNDAPSPYLDFLAAGREGLQHLGFWALDFPSARRHLELNGFDPEYTVQLPGAPHPVVYFNPSGGLGAMIEVSQSTPQKKLLFDAVAALGDEWDGRDPVRRYGSMAEFALQAGVPSWSSGGVAKQL